MGIVFALLGNQNSGKSTLFNALTGGKQHVGNWPGVTVEKKQGKIRKMSDVSIVDLPGIYSLSPYTSEEVISRNFIIEGGADAVINIVDATNIERNLYLTLQLAELGKPMIIALNMMDEIRANGDFIDPIGLEKALGIPVVPISAKRNEGIDKLISKAIAVAKKNEIPPIKDICDGHLHEALHAISCLVENKAKKRGYTSRYAATKLVEGDEPVAVALSLSSDEKHIIGEIVDLMEKKSGFERDAALADARYNFIENILADNVRKNTRSDGTLSNRIDKIITNKIMAIPIFLAVMYLVFWVTFGPIGTFIADGFSHLVDMGIGFISDFIVSLGLVPWLQSVINEGILTGVGSLLSFLPIILLLFLCLSFLEDSGYMARAAFVMDKLLRGLGLSGKSFIPLIMGFGCSVPALMAARTLDSERDRRLTMMITPFMSCGAKVPIYALFIDAFFISHKALIMLGIYALGIIIAIISGLILKNTLFKGDPSPFVMEMPAYRLPTFKSIVLHLWEKAKGFLIRAFTIILAASVVVSLMQSFTFSLKLATEGSQSMLGVIGSWVAWIFAPLGFGTWQASTAIFTGMLAKETIVSSLAVLYGAKDSIILSGVIQTIFTPLTAFSFMAFNLLATPCVAAVATLRREIGSLKWTIGTMLFQAGVAWVVAFLIFQLGRLFL